MNIEKARQLILVNKVFFPKLKPENLCVTSEPTDYYNCIAWAACDPQKWWWPAKLYFWPIAKREMNVATFVEAYQSCGFEVCNDGSPEAGFEKIAIYADDKKTPTHAARQLSDGTWTSKLGASHDVIHRTLDDISGGEYGKPVRFMRREKTPHAPSDPGPSGIYVRRIIGDMLGKPQNCQATKKTIVD